MYIYSCDVCWALLLFGVWLATWCNGEPCIEGEAATLGLRYKELPFLSFCLCQDPNDMAQRENSQLLYSFGKHSTKYIESIHLQMLWKASSRPACLWCEDRTIDNIDAEICLGKTALATFFLCAFERINCVTIVANVWHVLLCCGIGKEIEFQSQPGLWRVIDVELHFVTSAPLACVGLFGFCNAKALAHTSPDQHGLPNTSSKAFVNLITERSQNLPVAVKRFDVQTRVWKCQCQTPVGDQITEQPMFLFLAASSA